MPDDDRLLQSQLLNKAFDEDTGRLLTESAPATSTYRAFTSDTQTDLTVLTGYSIRETGGLTQGLVVIRDGGIGGATIAVLRVAQGSGDARVLPDVELAAGAAHADITSGVCEVTLYGRI